MKNAIKSLIIVDILVAGVAYFIGGEKWLINGQIGFISSSLVMLGSAWGYRSMVQGRLHDGAIPEERDTLDKLEDPYELYDEEKSLQEVVKEERANLKKSRRTLSQTTKDSKASFSFYRLGAYLILIVGFFYLNNNKLLDIPVYLFSLFLPMVVIVIALMRKK